MAKRSQPGGRRPRGRQRRVSSAQGRPAIPVVGSPESPAAVDESTRRQGAVQASRGTPSRHIVRDYSYVLVEVRRIIITGAIIVAGLVVAAVFLR